MQKDIASDQELNLKKRARRRLVGAIAMVLLMIILLPMLLKDRAVNSPAEDVTITLPSENQALDNLTSDKLPAKKLPSDFDSNIKPADKIPTDNKSADTQQAVAAPDNADVKQKLPADTLTSSETSANDTDINDTETVKSKPDMPTDSKASAQSEAKPEAVKPKPDANNRFYVQVGVFSDAANVKKLQSKLTDLGYKSQTEKINTDKGLKIKLRTQTFTDRNEAAIALENIKDAGLTGMVVSQQ